MVVQVLGETATWMLSPLLVTVLPKASVTATPIVKLPVVDAGGFGLNISFAAAAALTVWATLAESGYPAEFVLSCATML
ncbi:MAG: hypothetical protein ACYCRG_06460 [Acidimicrobiales bacterium]